MDKIIKVQTYSSRYDCFKGKTGVIMEDFKQHCTYIATLLHIININHVKW